MITVAVFDIDVVWWIAVSATAICVAVLTPLVVRQGKWQRDADTDPPGFTSDIGD